MANQYKGKVTNSFMHQKYFSRFVKCMPHCVYISWYCQKLSRLVWDVSVLTGHKPVLIVLQPEDRKLNSLKEYFTLNETVCPNFKKR